MTKQDSHIDPGSEGDFARRFCSFYRCRAGDFDDLVFWRCMYSAGRPVAHLLWYVNRDFFRTDLEMISELRYTTSYSQVRDIVDFYTVPAQHQNLLRRWLKIRMSKGKVLNLASTLFRNREN